MSEAGELYDRTKRMAQIKAQMDAAFNLIKVTKVVFDTLHLNLDRVEKGLEEIQVPELPKELK